MKRVLVIGATGTVGSAVVAQLAGTGIAVRGVARNPAAANLPKEVESVAGDLTVPETLDAALEGVDAVFLVWAAPPAAVGPAVERITKRAGRVVLLSSPHKTQHPLFQQPNPVRNLHSSVEQGIVDSGVEWTILRPGMFAANAREWWGRQIRAGETVRWPYLEVPTAPIHERDIAAVGVRALLENGHAGKEYVITGPESLSHREQVAVIGRAIGRDLKVEEMPPEEAMTGLGFPPVVAKMLLDAWAAAQGHPAFMTATAAEILGRPARTFSEWASDHAAEFRP